MATSPTPSLDSTRGTNSIESYGEHNDYLSDSPLTLSGSSPPVSDSAISDDFSSTGGPSGINSQHKASSASSSSTSSTSSSSGLSSSNDSGIVNCNSNLSEGSICNGIISGNVIGISTINGSSVPQCTACKSLESDAVAKCFECVNFLCSNCATAHEYMHCFNGHNVSMINSFEGTALATLNTNSTLNLENLNYSSSLSMILHAQQKANSDSTQKLNSSEFSKIVLTENMFESALQQNKFSIKKEDILSKLSVSNSMANNTNQISQPNLMHMASSNQAIASSQYYCNKHKTEVLTFFCRTCRVSGCSDCLASDHQRGLHDVERPQSITHKQSENIVHNIVSELRGKIGEIVSIINNSDANVSKIKMQYQKAYNEINETYQFFCSMLEERKQEVCRELESMYNAKISSNNTWTNKSKDLIEKAIQSCDNVESSPKIQNLSDILMLKKTIDSQQQNFSRDMQVPFELEFVSNYQSIQVGVRNTFGYIRANIEESSLIQKQPPIARPNHGSLSPGILSNNNLSSVCLPSNVLDRSFSSPSNGILGNSCPATSVEFESSLVSKRLNPNSYTTFMNDVGASINPYEKWSNGGSDSLFNGISEQYAIRLTSSNTNSGSNCTLTNAVVNNLTHQTGSDSLISLSSKMLSIYPPKSQIKRQKMIYHCKFGEFGVMEGQFTEPSGVAINAQNDIIVADTNNHRIQIFDKEGRFKFQFGECGKRDSQLLYPNRVAVVKTSGDIIVTERSPTHQIQIYNQYGQFVRKFGANILQHPRGVTVDNKGRIIVVECKVMRVIIFDQNGNVIQKFGCSKHLEFPNGVVVNDKQEIFISDNRAHCVKVFNYEGQYLRQIGGEGVTNYPIGVGINSNGEILIADNHNNFNLTIFTQDGHILSALESKVKHAQCFDVALMDDGSVVLASKDYRLYIYRYVQVPPIGL